MAVPSAVAKSTVTSWPLGADIVTVNTNAVVPLLPSATTHIIGCSSTGRHRHPGSSHALRFASSPWAGVDRFTRNVRSGCLIVFPIHLHRHRLAALTNVKSKSAASRLVIHTRFACPIRCRVSHCHREHRRPAQCHRERRRRSPTVPFHHAHIRRCLNTGAASSVEESLPSAPPPHNRRVHRPAQVHKKVLIRLKHTNISNHLHDQPLSSPPGPRTPRQTTVETSHGPVWAPQTEILVAHHRHQPRHLAPGRLVSPDCPSPADRIIHRAGPRQFATGRPAPQLQSQAQAQARVLDPLPAPGAKVNVHSPDVTLPARAVHPRHKFTLTGTAAAARTKSQ